MWPLGDWDEYVDYSCLGNVEIKIPALNLIEQNTGKLVLSFEDREYFTSEFPEKQLNIGARVEPYQYVGSVVFDLNNGERIFTDNAVPFLIFGEGTNFEPWAFEPKQYVIHVAAYSQSDGKGDLLSEATFTFTVAEKDVVTGIHEPEPDEFRLYPSPANYDIRLSAPRAWSIYATDNRQVASGKGQVANIAHLPAGIYIFKTDQETMRFIICR